jgi:hypothetical protein
MKLKLNLKNKIRTIFKNQKHKMKRHKEKLNKRIRLSKVIKFSQSNLIQNQLMMPK